MWGNVNGIPVSLLGVQLSSALHRGEENYISLIFSPSEIVIGQNDLAELQVTQMSMSISALNYMFSKLPLQTSLDKGTQRKTTENELPSLTQCTA